MTYLLISVAGPGAGLQAALPVDSDVIVGRSDSSHLCVPNDQFLSSRHFSIRVADELILLRDMGSANGTFVDGTRIWEHILRDDERISAGECVFRVETQRSSLPLPIDVLSSQTEPLYAVIDAARDPAIYPYLLSSGGNFWSLYQGKAALELEAVSPYLVHLPPRGDLLNHILAQGWGKAWGIFLTSDQSPVTIWHELRRSLMVTFEDSGKRAYFRFYDPRVLRIFLPIANEAQRLELLGSLSSILIEDDDPTVLLRFHSLRSFCGVERVALRGEREDKSASPTLSIAATSVYQTPEF